MGDFSTSKGFRPIDKVGAAAGTAGHVVINITAKAAKAFKKGMDALNEFGDKADDVAAAADKLISTVDSITGADVGPMTTFVDSVKDWYAAGGADGLQIMSDTIFSQENITTAQNMTTAFADLASRGMANLLAAANDAMPGITGLTLAIYGMWKALGPLGLVIAAITAGLQWLVDNWDSVVKAWEGFWKNVDEGYTGWWGIS